MNRSWNSLCPACKGYPDQQHTQDASCLEYQESRWPRGYEAQENQHTTDVMLGRTPVPAPSKEKDLSDVLSQSEPC